MQRLVATSSCATCGPVPGRQATEEDATPEWELAVPYKRTKLDAERLVLAAGGVCVNPTTPVGDGDRAPTPTGAMIRGVATGRYRAYPRIGVNLVDVRDVARGHVLALERGRPGERYLLGGVDLTMREVFAAVADLAGIPRPRVAVPYAAIRAGAALGLVNRNEAILARTPAYFSWDEGGAGARLHAGPSGAGAPAGSRRRAGPLRLLAQIATGELRQCFLRSLRESVPSPITPRKTRPTMSMPVITSRPSLAASKTSASMARV